MSENTVTRIVLWLEKWMFKTALAASYGTMSWIVTIYVWWKVLHGHFDVVIAGMMAIALFDIALLTSFAVMYITSDDLLKQTAG